MIRLVLRQVRTDPWPTLLLALTVALTSMIAVVAPRLSGDLDDRQLAERIGSLSAIQGDVSGAFTPQFRPVEASVDPWPGVREAAGNIRDATPEPLRSLLRPAQFVGAMPVAPSWVPPAETGYYKISLNLLVDPDLPEHAELIAGSWPQMVTDPAEPFQVALPDTFAGKAGLEVGDTVLGDLRVSGIFRVNDPDDQRWQHSPYAARTAEKSDPNRGLELIGGALFAPELAGGDPTMRLQTTFRITAWFGLDADAVTSRGVDVALLTTQLTGLQAKRYPTSTDDAIGPAQDFPVHTELSSALAEVLAQQRTTRTLIAVSAVGPIGVGIALVVLSCALTLHRRRHSIDLLTARGLSPRQLRRLLAVEGATLGLPAALLGMAVAVLAAPGPVPWWSWASALLTGMFPAVALAWSARNTSVGGRHELTASGRWRRVAELSLGLGAAAATWRLTTDVPPGDGGIDLLGVAAPVLLTLLVCLLVLRVLPLPLRLLVRRFRRGRGLTGFLGVGRALREPAGGVVPGVTIVLGTTMAVAGAALLGTISVGTERAAWAVTGSTLHVSGPALSDETLTRLRDLEGVDAVAPVSEGADNLALTVGDTTLRVRVWLAGPELVDAYALSRDGSRLPTAMFDDGHPVAVVLGGGATPSTGSGSLDGLGEVTVVGHLDQLPGVTDADAWALVPRDAWPTDPAKPTLALIATADDADSARVAEEVAAIVPQARIRMVDTELERLRQSPTTSGLSAIFRGLAATTAVLMVLAVFTAQAMRTRQLRTDAAVLRTLGLRPAQLRGLTAWELGPVVALALLTGVATGIGLAALMVHTADLRALTGGSFSPGLYLDPVGIGGVAVGLVGATALVVALTSWLAGRIEVAEQLRRGESG